MFIMVFLLVQRKNGTMLGRSWVGSDFSSNNLHKMLQMYSFYVLFLENTQLGQHSFASFSRLRYALDLRTTWSQQAVHLGHPPVVAATTSRLPFDSRMVTTGNISCTFNIFTKSIIIFDSPGGTVRSILYGD